MPNTTRKTCILSLQNVSVRRNNQQILNNISMKMHSGELVSLIGKNGAGKTTLCQVIALNTTIYEGTIFKHTKLSMSYLPQIHRNNFLVPMKVSDFILLGNKNIDLELESYLLDKLKLIKLKDQLIANLSGGEQQKVALVRALLRKPKLLILDEAMSNTDLISKGKVYKLVNEIRKLYHIAVLIVSHDLNFVIGETDWVVCLDDGKIGCQGNHHNILKDSKFAEIFGKYWEYYLHSTHMTK